MTEPTPSGSPTKPTIPVPEVLDLHLAFPTRTPIDAFLPPHGEIPDEFDRRNNPWRRLVQAWFHGGLKGFRFVPCDGVDPAAAIRALNLVLACFALQHEHKVAGAAFLLDQWFEDYFEPGSDVSVIHGAVVEESDG